MNWFLDVCDEAEKVHKIWTFPFIILTAPGMLYVFFIGLCIRGIRKVRSWRRK